MPVDAHRNFAISAVTVAPSPAAGGLSLTVADGTVFPAVPFNATVWPASAQPTVANAEIVRVTANAAGVLTITRSQESSSARTIIVGDQVAATITTKTLTDIEAVAGIATGRAKVGASSLFVIPGVQTTSPVGGASVVFAHTANRAAYCPFIVESPITIDAVVFEVTTAVAASTMRMCIYNADINWQPTTLVTNTDIPTVDTSTTGVKTSVITATTLPAGRYLFWTNASAAGLQTRKVIGVASMLGYNPVLGSSAYIWQIYATQTYAAPPSTGLAWTDYAYSTAQFDWWTFLRVTVP